MNKGVTAGSESSKEENVKTSIVAFPAAESALDALAWPLAVQCCV